jgi:ATP-dependent Clp protease ATP-binding subunit ClpA
VRSALKTVIDRRIAEPATDVGLTYRAKLALDLAAQRARQQDADLIGTQHLLCGLVMTKDGTAATVLEILGVDLQDLLASLELVKEFEEGTQIEDD